MRLAPRLVMADAAGNVADDPHLLMLCRRGGQWGLPRPEELMPLPSESQLFLLPARRAVGLDPASGALEAADGLAVAVFAAPGHTLSAHPCYVAEAGAPMLPLFAYGAVGFARGRFWVCARKVDDDPRQQFSHIRPGRMEREAVALLKAYPANRLIHHIIENCVRRYFCPAARNFALGRYEAPLPSARACNSRCLGCISAKEADSPLEATPQCRLDFTPTPDELAEVMRVHERRETKTPIYSFGQGCEGDPLVNADLLAESVRCFRGASDPAHWLGHGTVNCNTNGSRPEAVALLAKAGLTSLRVSLNSARPELCQRYYRPRDYDFAHIVESIRVARRHGLFVALNLLYFPGLTDTEAELEALARLVGENGVSMIQWRNLNIDPDYYWRVMMQESHAGAGAPLTAESTASMGLQVFMKRLRRLCPWLRYGYFNPWLGDRAQISAPLPGEWRPPTLQRRHGSDD